jgi:hypothetical protein
MSESEACTKLEGHHDDEGTHPLLKKVQYIPLIPAFFLDYVQAVTRYLAVLGRKKPPH